MIKIIQLITGEMIIAELERPHQYDYTNIITIMKCGDMSVRQV